jgi:hypothetical protein
MGSHDEAVIQGNWQWWVVKVWWLGRSQPLIKPWSLSWTKMYVMTDVFPGFNLPLAA